MAVSNHMRVAHHEFRPRNINVQDPSHGVYGGVSTLYNHDGYVLLRTTWFEVSLQAGQWYYQHWGRSVPYGSERLITLEQRFHAPFPIDWLARTTWINYEILDNRSSSSPENLAIEAQEISSFEVDLLPLPGTTRRYNNQVTDFHYYDTTFSVNGSLVYAIYLPHPIEVDDSSLYGQFDLWQVYKTQNASGATVWVAETLFRGYYVYCVSTLQLGQFLEYLQKRHSTSLYAE